MNIEDLNIGEYFVHCSAFEEWCELLRFIENKTKIKWYTGSEPDVGINHWFTNKKDTVLVIIKEDSITYLKYGAVNSSRNIKRTKIDIGSFISKKRSNLYEW